MLVRFIIGIVFINCYNTCLAQTSLCGSQVNYHDYSYRTLQIGDQCWFAENLRATMNNLGEEIQIKQDKTEWAESLLEPAITFPSDIYRDKYGVLYNYNAVLSDNICPAGWHVPNINEWATLANHLGGWEVSGYMMKSKKGWASPNNRTNISGFNALPAGCRDHKGIYEFEGTGAYWWSTSISTPFIDSWFCFIDDGSNDLLRFYFFNTFGYSVRCIRD